MVRPTLLEKFVRISLCVTDDAIAKLFVTNSLVTDSGRKFGHMEQSIR